MKKQILVVMASFMMMSSAFPTYAATVVAGGASASAQDASASAQDASTTQDSSSDGINWIIPRDTPAWQLNQQYGETDWANAEAIAQVRRWAEENKGDIPSIADEKARYEAIVTKVCDFLTYDTAYMDPHVAYTLRDGKGVCSDYTALTKALCDICGIQAKVSVGTMYGLNHDMLKVTINGREYYSDPIGYDSGAYAMLMDCAPAEYEDRGIAECDAAILTGDGVDGNLSVLNIEAMKRGEVVLCRKNGIVYYSSQEDAAAIEAAYDNNDYETAHKILDKYGVPYQK